MQGTGRNEAEKKRDFRNKEQDPEELRFANMFKGISAIDTREMSFRDYARQWENSTSYKNLTQSVQEEIKGIQELSRNAYGCNANKLLRRISARI